MTRLEKYVMRKIFLIIRQPTDFYVFFTVS
jgi:hypothetical protein